MGGWENTCREVRRWKAPRNTTCIILACSLVGFGASNKHAVASASRFDAWQLQKCDIASDAESDLGVPGFSHAATATHGSSIIEEDLGPAGFNNVKRSRKSGEGVGQA